MRPVKVKVEQGNAFIVRWDDGSETKIPLEKLRDFCPCATCREEKEIDTIVIRPRADNMYKIAKVTMVGSYAIAITWMDGHKTGIYEYSYLLELED